MTFEEFHHFLIDNSGITVKLISNLFEDNPSPVKPVFFKSFKSFADPIHRGRTIITDSIVLSFIALECTFIAAFYAFKMMIDLMMLEPVKAQDSLGGACAFLLAAGIQIFAALTAPVINMTDFIGSAINSISDCYKVNYNFTI